MYPVAILAGGMATRLRPLTETIPKALIEVAGKPFIAHQLAYLQKQGVTDVVLCTGYLSNMIEEYVGDGIAFGLHVKYSKDGMLPLGTGGALQKAASILGENFFVLYGDSYLPCNFNLVEKAYYESGKQALMAVYKNNNCWDDSNVCFKNGIVHEYNKNIKKTDMTYIDYGLSLASSKVLFNHTFTLPFDLSDLYHQLSIAGDLAGLEMQNRFYEIGSWQGIKEFENYILSCNKYL